jgi:hypothetical protein
MLADQHPIRRIEDALLATERCAAVLDDLSPIAGCPQAVMFKVHQGNIGRFLANSAAHRVLKKYFGEGWKERDVITEKMVEQCSRRFVNTWDLSSPEGFERTEYASRCDTASYRTTREHHDKDRDQSTIRPRSPAFQKLNIRGSAPLGGALEQDRCPSILCIGPHACVGAFRTLTHENPFWHARIVCVVSRQCRSERVTGSGLS